MIEEIDNIRPANPTIKYRGVEGPTIAKWVEHKRRTYHVATAFQDLARHPWVGERQGGTAQNQYTMTARNVDAELRKLPYAPRLQMTRGGLWPIVVGAELGEGPNPWSQRSNKRYAMQEDTYGRGGGRRDGEGGAVPIQPTRGSADTRGQGPAAPAAPAAPLPRREERGFTEGPRSGRRASAPDATYGARYTRRSPLERLGNVGGHVLSRGIGAVAGLGAGLATGAVSGNPVAAVGAARTAQGLIGAIAPVTGELRGARAPTQAQQRYNRAVNRGHPITRIANNVFGLQTASPIGQTRGRGTVTDRARRPGRRTVRRIRM